MSYHVSFEIEYTKAADKFFSKHEDVRTEYEKDMKKLLTDDHPEIVDVKRIKGKRNDYYRIRIGSVRIVRRSGRPSPSSATNTISKSATAFACSPARGTEPGEQRS